MTEHLSPDSLNVLDPDEQAILRARSRSPHPYHHQNTDLPHLSDRFSLRNRQAQSAKNGDDVSHEPSPTAWPPQLKDSPQTSDSGSEADDEHYLKGLPAPRTNLHKGLRGLNEPLSGSSTPLPSPALLDAHTVRTVDKPPMPIETPETKRLLEALKRRRRVVVRRATEAGIVLTLGLMVASNRQVWQLLGIWGKAYNLRYHTTRIALRWTTRFISPPRRRLGLPQNNAISPSPSRASCAFRPRSYTISFSDYAFRVAPNIFKQPSCDSPKSRPES
ncbi:dolichol kinase [Fusarium torreyae]|uniref:Dolichol kinase n=1 Tax=Fusarium torreyae TaxID=1237075 RepID=A0A9W8RVD1_9HYPO|nr:dolichol kinase [Fusarium torreyae]